METTRQYAAQLEDHLDRLATPLKPHVPLVARFLLVVTFLEDTVRIVTQWHDQTYYLEQYQHMPWGITHLFLLLNIALMLTGSILAIARRYVTVAVGMLAAVIVLQSVGYGLLFHLDFFLRNLSVVGGLLMLLSDAVAKKPDLFAGLPRLSDSERSTYLMLAGRVLLVGLFFSFLLAGEMSFFRIVMIVVGFVVSVLVVVGFKAKYSALVLVLVLSVANVVLNNWWSLHHNHPQRDFMKYDFFQTLSIMGGLLLLFSLGPGSLSVDEKKKGF